MSYFSSAREAARVLGVPLLLRADPDPQAFRRHDRLGTLAVPAAAAARLVVRARDEAAKMGERVPGLDDSGVAGAGATWVTGPWGSLDHLPWAVGLADQLARERGRAALLEREPDGPLRALAGRGRRVPIVSPLATSLLGEAAAAVGTDLEGVLILVPRGVAVADVAGAIGAFGDVPVVLADGLPEVLEGPYPGAEHVAGVILVAPFRDHSRFELDAVVRRLRETGHRILGLVAIGPEVSELEEAAALRADPDEPLAGASVGSRELAAPAGDRGEGLTASAFAGGPSMPPPTEAPAPPSEVPVPPGRTPPLPDSIPPSSAQAVPLSAQVVPSSAEAAPPSAQVAPCSSEAAPSSAVVSPEPEAPLPSSGLNPLLSGALRPAPGPVAIPLLASWDRQGAGKTRKRRRTSGVALALLVLVAAAVYYAKLVAPRFGTSSEAPAPSGTEASPVPGGGGPADSVGAMVDDSTGRGADSSGTRSRAAPGVVPGAVPDTTAMSADSVRDAAAWNAAPDTAAGRAAPWRAAAPDTAAAAAALRAGVAWNPASASGGSRPGGPSLAAGDRFVIHFSSFKLEAEAEAEVMTLRRRGIEARSIRVEIPERGTWYRIVTGNFATFAEAESVVLRLQAEGKIPYAHIAADGGRGQPVPVGTLDRERP
jgi:hypothetical protein